MATNGHIQPLTPHDWRNQSIIHKCEWSAETTNAVGTYVVAECVSPHSNGMDVDMEISYLRFLARAPNGCPSPESGGSWLVKVRRELKIL